jgi:hypothetical protein
MIPRLHRGDESNDLATGGVANQIVRSTVPRLAGYNLQRAVGSHRQQAEAIPQK